MVLDRETSAHGEHRVYPEPAEGDQMSAGGRGLVPFVFPAKAGIQEGGEMDPRSEAGTTDGLGAANGEVLPPVLAEDVPTPGIR